MSLFLIIAVPLLGSLLASLLPTNARNAESTLAGVCALAGLVGLGRLYPQLQAGGVIREELTWLPQLGVNLVARVDGFAWMFGMLVLGMGLLVVVYARYYMSPSDPMSRFYAAFLAFMGAMLGVVLSGNLIQMVLFWEMTSLFSFLLIGYWHHRRDARRGARMAVTITSAGGLCLLAGVLMLGHIVGSHDIEVVLAAGDAVRAHRWYPAVLALVLVGALTKSAQFPFHFWLPHAMAAPTPVSAYLHSATMVKAGVFLLARLWPVLSGTEAWFWMVGGAGLFTLLLGAYAAMFQNDLKGVLAYSTISHLGLITLLLGLNSQVAAVAAVFHIMNHATFKASLFMAAGIIDHETGTRDIRRLDGLFRRMPITAVLAMVASASMAGVPLLNGFLSKEMFFAETVYISSLPWVENGLPLIATLAGVFAVVYSLRFSVDIFFGKPSGTLPRQPHDPTRWMLGPVALLVLACLVVGMAPEWAVGPLLALAARPVVGGTLPDYSLAVWHGVNAPFLMSLVALGGGLLLYRVLRHQLEQGHFQQTPLIHRLDGQRVFTWGLAVVSKAARLGRRLLSTRRLQPQLFLLVLTAGVLAAWSLHVGDATYGLSWGNRPPAPAAPLFVLLWLVGGACALGVAMRAKYHRLTALIMMGVAGLATCLTFVWFSAPDLALTQLLVEIVTTVLFLLGLRWLPQRLVLYGDQALSNRLRRVRDAVLAVLVGGGLAALSYALMTRTAPQSISPFFLDKALTEGGGANVVNVMLVDFRSFDTLGEITVLGAVGLTVYALLRRFRPPRESLAPPHQQRVVRHGTATDLVQPHVEHDSALGYLFVPTALARLLLPVSCVVAVHLFMRGHQEPGGGFVAGLVVAVAFIMQYMVSGTRWVEARMVLYPARWIAVGLFFALGTGLGALAFGHPFLTTHTLHLTLPWLGEVHLASALLFDVGVFAVVVGSTLLILTALGHQSLRGRRQSAASHVASPGQASEGGS